MVANRRYQNTDDIQLSLSFLVARARVKGYLETYNKVGLLVAGCARCTAVGCTTTDTNPYGLRTDEQFRINMVGLETKDLD